MIDFGKLIDPNFKPYSQTDWEHYNEVKGNDALGWAKDAFDAGALGFLGNVADASQEYLGVGGDLAKTLGNLAEINGKTSNLTPDSSGYLTNNQGLLYDVFNSLGSSAPMFAMTAGAGLGAQAVGKAITPMLSSGTVANLAKVASMVPESSVFGKSIPLGKLALGNIASSVPEAIGEAGGAIADAREQGLSPDAVRNAGNDTFSENLKLLATSNTIESLGGLGLFSKFGRVADGASRLAKVGAGMARVGAGAGFGAMQNAYEEGVQSEIPMVALGKSPANAFDPSQWSKESRQASDVGFMVGGVIGGVGGTAGSVLGKSQDGKPSTDTLTPVNAVQEQKVVEDASVQENAIPQAVDAMTNRFMADPDYSPQRVTVESLRAMIQADPILKDADERVIAPMIADSLNQKWQQRQVDLASQAQQQQLDNDVPLTPQDVNILRGVYSNLATSGGKKRPLDSILKAIQARGAFVDVDENGAQAIKNHLGKLFAPFIDNGDTVSSEDLKNAPHSESANDRETLFGGSLDFPNLSSDEASFVARTLDYVKNNKKTYLTSKEFDDIASKNKIPFDSITNIYKTLNKLGVIAPDSVKPSEHIASYDDSLAQYRNPISRKDVITRNDVRSNPDTYYVFGDNDQRRGLGGQAKEMRGAKNSIGIRTKKSPSMDLGSFYSDRELSLNKKKIDEDISNIRNVLSQGKKVVIPSSGIGTGLADLKNKAPQTFNYLQSELKKLYAEHTVQLKNKPSMIHSGGASGSDTAFALMAKEQGIPIQNHSFAGHSSNVRDNLVIHDDSELEDKPVVKSYNDASYNLGRNIIDKSKKYVRNLVLRDYYQVKDSDAILAIGRILKGKGRDGSDIVDGGTGYAVEYGKQANKPIFVVDNGQLNKFDYSTHSFVPTEDIPNLSGLKIAGVGTRNITPDSADSAIRRIFSAEKTVPVTYTNDFFTDDLDDSKFTISTSDSTSYINPVSPLNDSVTFDEKDSTFTRLAKNARAKVDVLSKLDFGGTLESVVPVVNSKGKNDQVNATMSPNDDPVVHFNSYDTLISSSDVGVNKHKFFSNIPVGVRYAFRLSQLMGYQNGHIKFFNSLKLKTKDGSFANSGIVGFQLNGVTYVSTDKNHAPFWTFGHEFGHKMKESPSGSKVFNAFKNSFVEALDGDSGNLRGEKLNKLLSDYAGFNGFKILNDGKTLSFQTPTKTLSRNQLLDEIICDIFADRMADGNFLEIVAKEFEGKKGFLATTFTSIRDFARVLREKALSSPESGLDYALFRRLGTRFQFEVDTILANEVVKNINTELLNGGLEIDYSDSGFSPSSPPLTSKENATRLAGSKKINSGTLGLKGQTALYWKNRKGYGKATQKTRDNLASWAEVQEGIGIIDEVSNNAPSDFGARTEMKHVGYAGQENIDFDNSNELIEVSRGDSPRVIHWGKYYFRNPTPYVNETPATYLTGKFEKADSIEKTFDYIQWKAIKDFTASDFFTNEYSVKEKEYNSVQDELAKTEKALSFIEHSDSVVSKNTRMIGLINDRINKLHPQASSNKVLKELFSLVSKKKELLQFINKQKDSRIDNLSKLTEKKLLLSEKADKLHQWLIENDKAYDARMLLIHKYLKRAENVAYLMGRNYKDSGSISTDAYITLCQLTGLKYLNHRVTDALQKLSSKAVREGKSDSTGLTSDFTKARNSEFDAFKVNEASGELNIKFFSGILASEIQKRVSESASEYDISTQAISKAEIKKFKDVYDEETAKFKSGDTSANPSPFSIGERFANEKFDSWLAKMDADGTSSKPNFDMVKEAKRKEYHDIWMTKAINFSYTLDNNFVSYENYVSGIEDGLAEVSEFDVERNGEKVGEETSSNLIDNGESSFHDSDTPNASRFGLGKFLKTGDTKSFGAMYVFHSDAISNLGWKYKGHDNFKAIKDSLDSTIDSLTKERKYFNDLSTFKLLPKADQLNLAVKAGFDSVEDLLDAYHSALESFRKNPKILSETLDYQKKTGKKFVSEEDLSDSPHSESGFDEQVRDYSENKMNNPDFAPNTKGKDYHKQFVSMILKKVKGIKEQLAKDSNGEKWFGIADKLLRSPSKLAQMFPKFKPFYDLAVKSKIKEEGFKKKFMDTFNDAWNHLKPEQKTSLQAIFLMGDKLSRELTEKEMGELGADKEVIKAYSDIRNLLNHLRDMINRVNKLTGRDEIGYINGYFPHHWDMYKVISDGKDASCYKSFSEAQKVVDELKKQGVDAHIQIDEGNFHGNFTESGMVNTYSISAEDALGVPVGFLEDDNISVAEKHRYLKQLLERKGMRGYSTNVEHVIRKYVNTSARYLALEPFKYETRILFDNVMGDGRTNSFDLDWSGKPLESYTKDYINGVCGYPTNIEKFFDHIIAQSPYIRDFIVRNTSYGTRYSVGLANMATEVVAVTTLGFWNPATGILQLSQLANVSTLCGNKLTKEAIERLASGKLTDDDKIALRRSKVEFDSNLANEGYAKGTKSSYNDKIQAIAQKSMWMFENGDMFVRKVAVMAGYQQGLEMGLSKADAIRHAVEVNRKCNFDNSIVDSSGAFRSLSVLGQVGLQFKKYGLKQLEFCYDTLIAGDNKDEKIRFLATMAILGGIMGIPFLDAFDEILKALFGKTIDEDLRNYALENMGNGGQKALVEFALYGAGSLVGVDLSRRAGQANLLGGSTENFFPAVGRTFNLIKHVRETGITSQAIADIIPSAGNAVTGFVEGHPRGINKIQYTPTERLIRATGFIPLREAEERDKQHYSMANNGKKSKDKKDKKD